MRLIPHMDEIEQVLDFWFGACGAEGTLDPEKKKIWFGDGRTYDAGIRERFGALHERASRGELEQLWAATPLGRIALIVVLDQFSRHIHRGTAAAFAQDPAAQRLVISGLGLNADHALIPAQRAFFYVPLEHAEDLEMQRLGVRCFDGLVHTVSEARRKDYEEFLDYAQRHRDIIKRFGRFPHRNAMLERASTPQEIKFLKQPGSSF
jgi:uncharacterized protein (DUF924 family)